MVEADVLDLNADKTKSTFSQQKGRCNKFDIKNWSARTRNIENH